MDRKRWKGEELMNEVGVGCGEKGRARKNGRECEGKKAGSVESIGILKISVLIHFEWNIFPDFYVCVNSKRVINCVNSFTLEWEAAFLSKMGKVALSKLAVENFTFKYASKQFILRRSFFDKFSVSD